MTAFKVLKWLTILIVTPWLVFMLTAAFKGSGPIKEMGEFTASAVRALTVKLGDKADTIKIQADEWKEKITGKKAEEAKPAAQEKPQDKKSKKKSKNSDAS